MGRLNDKDHAETMKKCRELHEFMDGQGDDDNHTDEFTEVWLALNELIESN